MKSLFRYFKMILLGMFLVLTNQSFGQDTCLINMGEIVLTSQQQINAWPGCSELKTTLIIDGYYSNITNLDSLIGLKRIEGYLRIQNTSELLDLSGLDSLTVVTSNVHLNDNVGLINLNGLENLDSIGYDLYIQNNPQLETISTLTGLANIGNHLTIYQNKSLSSCCEVFPFMENVSSIIAYNSDDCENSYAVWNACGTFEEGDTCGEDNYTIELRNQAEVNAWGGCKVVKGSVSISEEHMTNDPIINLDSLITLVSIENRLYISNTDSLATFQGLNNLKNIGGDFQVTRNDVIENLDALDQLVNVESIYIKDNKRLKSIETFNSITGSISLTLLSNDSLVSTNTFSELRQLDYLSIRDNSELISIEGFQNVKVIESQLSVSNNAKLTSIGAFGNVDSIRRVNISDNSSLSIISGLRGLEYVEEILTLSKNQSLKSVSDFENLSVIGGELSIYGNDSLLSLEGFKSLDTITGAISVFDNDTLNNCQSIELLIEKSPYINIYNNLEGCDSLGGAIEIYNETIKDTCGSKGSTITLQTQSEVNSWGQCKVVLGGIKIGIYEADYLIVDLSPLIGLKEVRDNIDISFTLIEDLIGLDSLEKVGAKFDVSVNTRLENLDGLENLRNVGSSFELYRNFDLADLTGISNLDSIGKDLHVEGSNYLTSLEGIEGVRFIGEDLIIADNSQLSTCCIALPLANIAQSSDFSGNDVGCKLINEIEDVCSLMYRKSQQFICEGDSLFIHGQFQSMTGVFVDSFTSSNLYDSISTVTLSHYPTYVDTTEKTINKGDSVYLSGSFQSVSGIYSDSLQTQNGCDSVVHTRLVVIDSFSFDDLVWPGDCDNDGVVDMFDVLPLGFRYGNQGDARDSISIMWMGHGANNWNSTFRGVNLMYADANGNGELGFSDAQAIIDNYSFTHNRSNGGRLGTNEKVWLSFSKDTVRLLDTLDVIVNLGLQDQNEVEAYALLFKLKSSLETESELVEVDFSESWMGEKDDDLISLYKEDKRLDRPENSIDFGMIRTDQMNRLGAGQVAKVILVIDDIIGGRRGLEDITEVEFRLEEVKLYNAEDSLIEVESSVDTLKIMRFKTDVADQKKKETKVNVYPNPTNSLLNIELSTNSIESIVIRNIIGQNVFQAMYEKLNSVHLDVSGFDAGIYLVEIQSNNQVLKEKIMIH